MIPPDTLVVDGRSWPLTRAWPRSCDEVSLELADPSGRPVVGRWFADAQEARAEAERTPGSRRADDPHLLLHPDGADRKLPRLATAVAAGGELIAHRPHRRGVVRSPSGTYLKLTRPGRAATLLRRHEQLAAALEDVADVPRVRHGDPEQIELEPLQGLPPLDTLTDDRRRWTARWEQVGGCVEALARTTPDDDLPTHDAQTEADVTRTWVRRAVDAGRLPPRDVTHALAALLDGAITPSGLAHRDLHDGQLVFNGRAIGVLDPDTLAAAEPALDLANLLVHLDLRVAQGVMPAHARDDARHALLRGAAPDAATLQRVPPFARACRLRLAGVYAFRPAWHQLARRWYDQALDPDAAPEDGAYW